MMRCHCPVRVAHHSASMPSTLNSDEPKKGVPFRGRPVSLAMMAKRGDFNHVASNGTSNPRQRPTRSGHRRRHSPARLTQKGRPAFGTPFKVLAMMPNRGGFNHVASNGFSDPRQRPTFSANANIIGAVGLTTVFGMGTGVSPPLWSPGNFFLVNRKRV